MILPRFPRRARVAMAGAPLLWCVLLTLVGAAALFGSTWMLLVFVAGSVGEVDWASSYVATERGVTENRWHFEASIHWLVGVGLLLFCLAIAIFNATWLEARKHMAGLLLHVVTVIGACVALFMVSGAIVVQQRGTDARDRDVAVAAQTAQVGVVSAQDRLDALRGDLERLQGDNSIASPSYQMQACRAGARGWAGYITQAHARADPRLDQIERAMNSAQECDRLKSERDTLLVGVSRARVAAVAAAPPATETSWMHAVTVFLEDARKPVTAVLGELLAMTAFGFALASWRTRRPVDDAAPMLDAAHAIPDLRDEAPVAAQPMEPTRIVDGETGEEMIRVAGSKPHFRKKKQRGPKVSADGIEPGAPYPVPAAAGEHGAEAGPVEAAEQTEAASETIEAQDGAFEMDDATARAVLELTGDLPPDDEPPPGTPLPRGEGVMLEDENEEHDAHVRAREKAMEAA